MNKIIKINIKDIIYDHKQASEIINTACIRSNLFTVKGAFKQDQNILLCLEGVTKDDLEYKSYLFAQIEDCSEDGIIAEINSRYRYGFTTISCFEINDQVWGLFAEQKN